MTLERSDVDTPEKPVQQFDGQCHDLAIVIRPDEAIIGLESLEHEPETVVLPAQDLDAIASPVGKNVERGIHGIQAHRLFDENRQTVHSRTGNRRDRGTGTPSDFRRTGTRHPPEHLDHGAQFVDARCTEIKLHAIRQSHMQRKRDRRSCSQHEW